jgi:hypothetical protein
VVPKAGDHVTTPDLASQTGSPSHPETQLLTTDSANLLASDISQKLGHLIAGVSETTRTRQALPPGEVDIFKPEQHRRGFPRQPSELVASLGKPARGWWGYHPAFSLHIKI